MKHSTIMIIVTLFVFAIAIFSAWFFPLNGATLAGLMLNTFAIVVGLLSAVIVGLLLKEGN